MRFFTGNCALLRPEQDIFKINLDELEGFSVVAEDEEDARGKIRRLFMASALEDANVQLHIVIVESFDIRESEAVSIHCPFDWPEDFLDDASEELHSM